MSPISIKSTPLLEVKSQQYYQNGYKFGEPLHSTCIFTLLWSTENVGVRPHYYYKYELWNKVGMDVPVGMKVPKRAQTRKAGMTSDIQVDIPSNICFQVVKNSMKYVGMSTCNLSFLLFCFCTHPIVWLLIIIALMKYDASWSCNTTCTCTHSTLLSTILLMLATNTSWGLYLGLLILTILAITLRTLFILHDPCTSSSYFHTTMDCTRCKITNRTRQSLKS